MEVKNKKETKNTLEFNLKGANEVFANTLRRALITNVPVFAPQSIAVITNCSPMYDEILAHRIGMIPFTYSDKYKTREECKCKNGCDKCSVTLALKKKGATSVYSGDFKSSDKNVIPVCKEILITKLEENMELNLETMVVLGTFKNHAKFQNSITSISYDNPNEITFKIKSITGRKPKDLLLASIDILKNKLTEFKKEVKQSKEL